MFGGSKDGGFNREISELVGSVRVARIQQLFDLNRRAMDLLAQLAKGY